MTIVARVTRGSHSSEQEVCEEQVSLESEKEKQSDLREVVCRKSDETVRCVDKQDIALEKRMVQWRKAWWIRFDDGPNLRTAKHRRRAVRAATRAVDETWQCEEARRRTTQRSLDGCAAEEAPNGVNDEKSYFTKEDVLSVRNLMKKEVSEAVRRRVLRLKSQQLRTMPRSAEQASTQTRTHEISVLITAVNEMTFAQRGLATEVKMLQSGMAQAGKTHWSSWFTGEWTEQVRQGWRSPTASTGRLVAFFFTRENIF